MGITDPPQPRRPDAARVDSEGATTDQLTWRVADWADTAITTLRELRAGTEFTDEVSLTGRMRHISQLQGMLAALQDELLLIAREDVGDGKARVSWRELAFALGQHFTSIRERWTKLMEGGGHPWRAQITDGTPRADRRVLPAGPDDTPDTP